MQFWHVACCLLLLAPAWPGAAFTPPLSSRIFTMAKEQTVVLAWNFANIFLPQVDIVCDFCLLKSDGFFLRYVLFCDATTREFCQKWINVAGLSKTHFYEKYLMQMKGQTMCTDMLLTRAWPGSQPNAIDRGGGGAYNAPPQANSQTNDRSETGEAALERSRRDGSKALLKFFLKGHVSGQSQVKGQNWAFQHFGSQNRQLDSNRPKLDRNTLKG